MTVFLKRLFRIFIGLAVFSACSSDDATKEKSQTYTLNIKAIDKAEKTNDFSNFKYTLVNQNTSQKKGGKLDKGGRASVEVEIGTYDLELISKEGAYGSQKNISVSGDRTVEISVEWVIPTVSGLIISEIFTSGEEELDEEGEYIDIGDQYVVIYNNSDEVKYLDGVSFAVTAHWNKFPYNEEIEGGFKENAVYADFIYTFPGSGEDFPINPGEEKVLARSAIDYSENGRKKNAADLSGADFEVFMPGKKDNITAENMILNGNIRINFLGYGVGFNPPFLFKQEGDLKQFLDKNAIKIPNMMAGNMKNIYKIPADIIIDGVETGQHGMVKFKSLLPAIDRGFITVSDAGTREVYVRKGITTVDGRKILQDTNNSTEDFEIRVGQRNFPAK